jgi:hypothetical protein
MRVFPSSAAVVSTFVDGEEKDFGAQNQRKRFAFVFTTLELRWLRLNPVAQLAPISE